MLLTMLWRWPNTLNCVTPSSPDTLGVLLDGFTSRTWSTATEFAILDRHELAWWSRFLGPERNFLKTIWLLYRDQQHLHLSHKNVFLFYPRRHSPIRTCEAFVPKLDSVQLSIHTERSTAQHISATTSAILPTTMGTLPPTVWTVPVTTYRLYKAACTTTLQNFWLAQVYLKKKDLLFIIKEKKILLFHCWGNFWKIRINSECLWIYVEPSISFQTYFVQAFKIVVDS